MLIAIFIVEMVKAETQRSYSILSNNTELSQIASQDWNPGLNFKAAYSLGPLYFSQTCL